MKTIEYSNLTDLAAQVHQDNVKKGFYDEEYELINKEDSIFKSDDQFFFVRNALYNQKLMLIGTEVAEACEAVRKGRFCVSEGTEIEEFCNNTANLPESEYAKAYKELVKDRFEAEIAGTIIRCLDLAGFLNIDIERHIQAELRYNRTRPYKHAKNC